MNLLNIAKRVFEIESNEIANLSSLLTIDFEEAVNSIFKCRGKLIVSGIGISAIVGKKIASTLPGTGTPRFFLLNNKKILLFQLAVIKTLLLQKIQILI